MDQALIRKIAVLCKDFYSLRTIDDLFLYANANISWKVVSLNDLGSSRMNAVYGWVEGLQQHAPDKLGQIIKKVASQISNNPDISEADKSFLKSALSKSDLGLPLPDSEKKIIQNAENKKCFIICPFGMPGSEIRKRSDRLLKYVITPAVEEFGYEVNREDILNRPGHVTTHVIRSLRDEDLVIVDLTGGNPNVFYELAIRHVTKKPCIQLLRTQESPPFNVQEMQTISYDLDDVEQITKTIEGIKKQLRYFEEGGEVINPVTIALEN